MENENWKDVINYEGIYQVSNKGRVRSLPRKDASGHNLQGKIISPAIDAYGYLQIGIYKEGKNKTKKIHQLVAESFLNYTQNGYDYVIDHIDFNKSNNNLENLRVVTVRENTNLKHIPHSSKYTGVSKNGKAKKWIARIRVKGKLIHLGSFGEEIKAHEAYQTYLINISQ